MYGIVSEVVAPVEMYDAVHAELYRRTSGKVDGLLVHIGRPTERGFEAVEVWESREHFERYAEEIVDPVVAELTHGQAPPASESAVEFEVRGLVLPGTGLWR